MQWINQLFTKYLIYLRSIVCVLKEAEFLFVLKSTEFELHTVVKAIKVKDTNIWSCRSKFKFFGLLRKPEL